jgi:hypothetical protein
MHDIGRRVGDDLAPKYPDNGWPRTLALWRTLPAESFDTALKREVETCVANASSTIPAWCDAAGGAAAAIRLALSLAIPTRFSIRTDLAMTTLLARAFDDAQAAVVMSQIIRLMPLEPRIRGRLATSWLAHNLRRLPRRRGKDSIAWKLMYGGDDL